MDCPRCKSPLASCDLEGVAVVDRCATCHGTWVPRASFRAVAEDVEEDAGWLGFELWRDAERFEGVAGDRPCPVCSKPMALLTYGDAKVQVDACSDGEGVWLDADELEQTVTALRDELVRMPTTELLSGALDEASEIAKGGGALAAEWKHFWRVARLLELRVLADHPELRRLLLSLQGGRTFP